MKITADTNVLVRAAMMDDRAQGALAARALLEAEAVAVTLPCLCEFVWVLMRGYGRSGAEVAAAIRSPARAFWLIDRLWQRGSPFLIEGVISPTG